MSVRLKNIIEELKVKIIYDDNLEKQGHYIASCNTIVISNSLDNRTRSLVLLHELGHAAMHQDNYRLYKLTYSMHSKMENEAEEFVIEETLEVYLSSGLFEVNQINYIHFLELNEFDSKYEPFIKKLLQKKYGESQKNTTLPV
ncbi:MAG: ImmA/IrrE family metallo-endopeptidase [Bacilli bacterium]